MPPSSGLTTRRLPPWMPLLVVALAWAAQGRVLSNGWVWDDAVKVRDDAVVAKGFAGIPRLVTEDWFAGVDDVGLYRPLVSATLATEAAFHGTESAFGFHLTNLFLHGLAAVLFLAVAWRLLPGRPVVASAAALLFAAHPMHTGTVSWIVARGDLLAAVFGLLAVLAWFRGSTPTIPSVLLAALCTLLAVLGKEMALTIPAVLWILDAGVRGEGLIGALKRRPFAYLALAAVVGGYMVLRTASIHGLAASPDMAALGGRNIIERLAIGAGGLFRTAGNLAIPLGLSGDASNDSLYEVSTSLPLAYFIGAALAAALTVVAFVRLVRGRAGVPDAAWGLFVVLSLPVMQIVPLGAIFEDRFGYVPSLGLLLLGGLLAERLLALSPRGIAAAACGLVLLAFSATAWATAGDWQDNFTFNRALLRDDPAHKNALRRLGREYLNRGNWRIAYSAVRRADDPSGIATRDEGTKDFREAVAILTRAAALPGNKEGASTWKALGDAQFALQDLTVAAKSYQKALALKKVRAGGRDVNVSLLSRNDIAAIRGGVSPATRSFLADVYHRRGIALSASAEKEAGAAALEIAVAWEPGRGDYQRRAGTELALAGRTREALPYLAAAAVLAQGDDRRELDGLYRDTKEAAETKSAKKAAEGRTAEAAGREADALALFEAAIDEWPDSRVAWDGALQVLSAWKGDRDAAVEHLERLLDRLDAADVRADHVDRVETRKKIQALVARFTK